MRTLSTIISRIVDAAMNRDPDRSDSYLLCFDLQLTIQILFGSVLFIAMTVPVFGQTTNSISLKTTTPSLLRIDSLPNAHKRLAQTLGDRVTVSGKERLNVTASLSKASGPAESIVWIWELPGRNRIQRGSGRLIVFDLDNLSKASGGDTLDEEIVEALSEDTAEQFLYKIQNGVIPRSLGQRFRISGKTGFGAECDLFEIDSAANARSSKGSSVKQFMFDSPTGLLSRVHYFTFEGGKRTSVVCEYSNYHLVSGYQIPATITRTHNGVLEFKLDHQTVVLQGAVLDGAFAAIP